MPKQRDEVDPDYLEWQAEQERVRRKIAQDGERDLRALARVGAARHKLLLLLALEATKDMSLAKDGARRASDRLSALADQIEALAVSMEAIAKDPLCTGQFWLALTGYIYWNEVREPIVPVVAISEMRRYAEYSRKKGALLRKSLNRIFSRTKHLYINTLIDYVYVTTGANHYDNLARLLTDAYAAVNLRKEFSTSGLLKHRQRHSRISVGKLAEPRRIAETCLC